MESASLAKVGAAAAAAWWTFLIGLAFVVLQWLLYLALTSAKPAFVLSLWGPDATWEGIRTTWFNALLLMKLSLWPLALAALWLTIWARRLRTPRA